MLPTLILAAIVTNAPPASYIALPAALSRALRNYDRAHFKKDTRTLSELTSSGYMVLNSNSYLEAKARFLADFRVPGFKIDPYVRTKDWNYVWNDAAITVGVVKLRWTQNGQMHAKLLRYTDVWRKHRGRWEVTFTQVTLAQTG
jgi:hypothetical protein